MWGINTLICSKSSGETKSFKIRMLSVVSPKWPGSTNDFSIHHKCTPLRLRTVADCNEQTSVGSEVGSEVGKMEGNEVGKTEERMEGNEVGNVVGNVVGKTAERMGGRTAERTAERMDCNRCSP